MKKLINLTLTLTFVSCVPLPPKQSENRDATPSAKSFQTTQKSGIELKKSLTTVFPDATLREHINKALKQSPTIKQALYRIEEAGFNTRKSQSNLIPSLDGGSSISRSRAGNSFVGSNTAARYSASFDSQWEVDVWGRIAANVSTSRFNEEATKQDFHAIKQSVVAQTTQAYFNFIAAKKSETLAEKRLASLSQTYQSVDRRFSRGTTRLEDLELAKSDLASTRANLAERQNTTQLASRTLSTLTGSYPTAFAKVGNWPKLNRSVPAGLPSTLLMNRPDIRAAFTRIQAADSSVKIAHSDLYPRFNLTASLGQQSTILTDLIRGKATIWSLAGGVTAPLLDGGNRKAELGAANARAKQALAFYQSTALTAFEEVENALGAETFLNRQQQATAASLEAAKKAEQRIIKSYEKGLTGILTLLETQRRRFEAEERLISVKNQRYQNRVTLALALGKAY